MTFRPFGFFTSIFSSAEIRKKILITFLILIIFRVVAHIPAAGVDRQSLSRLFSGNAFLALLDIFSGGTLGNFSILALGLNPYINASIILQLFTYISPRLEELQEEGEYGQERINQYTRFLTLPLAFLQSFTVYIILQKQGVIGALAPLPLLALVITMTTGTMFAVWLGELITEYGIGNGASFLIFAGIISRLPLTFGQSLGQNIATHGFQIAALIIISLLIVCLVVLVNDAVRRVPIHYARRAKRTTLQEATYLPLKLNHAGVIPIIFAVSLVILPSVVGQFLLASGNPSFSQFAGQMLAAFRSDGPLYTM
jgi:preprotein translocase subunit SecY